MLEVIRLRTHEDTRWSTTAPVAFGIIAAIFAALVIIGATNVAPRGAGLVGGAHGRAHIVALQRQARTAHRASVAQVPAAPLTTARVATSHEGAGPLSGGRTHPVSAPSIRPLAAPSASAASICIAGALVAGLAAILFFPAVVTPRRRRPAPDLAQARLHTRINEFRRAA